MAATILIVDDSKAARKILGRLLGDNGFYVVEAEDGERGLEILETTAISLIITDMNMPVKNGQQMLEEIRNDNAYVALPILILSANAPGTEEGPDGVTKWLGKPYKREALIEEVKAALAAVG